MNQITFQIPLENLTRQYERIRAEVEPAVLQVLASGKYILGPTVQAFEQEFAALCQTNYALGISNGTEALHLALLACNIGAGDEVITVPNTYAATVFAITYTGATPVFVDVDSITFNMDIEQVKKKITPRTRAILPVHMYGQMVPMDALMEVANQHGIWVIEDAAHAHGAEYQGKRAGSWGHIGCFSFYPTKVLGACGDGGAVTTNDPQLYDRLKVLRYMGQHVKYVNEIVGYQQRLDELQAAILRVKLRYLDEWINARQRWAKLYSERLKGLPVITPQEVGEVRHTYYLYTIRAQHRDALMAFLSQHGISTAPIYPNLVPYQPAYQELGLKPGAFPVADAHLGEILCLPMFPELTEQEVVYVTDAIREFYHRR